MLRAAVFLVMFLSLAYPSSGFAELLPDAAPPGTTVTIGGEEFGEFASMEVNGVDFNGIPALIQLWEPDLIMVKVPLAAQTGPVTVKTANKRFSVGTFSVKEAKITKLSHSHVEPGSLLVIEGEHFGNTAGSRDPNTMFGVNLVLINGIRAEVRHWRPNKITVKIPANATSGKVVVKLASSDPLPDGSCCAPVAYHESNTVSLTLIPPIAYQPSKGPVGSKVVLSGQDFGKWKPGSDSVLFNNHPATIAQWSERTIVVHVPLNGTSGPLVLKRGDHERVVGEFSVVTGKVKQVAPLSGPIGTLVRIKGENFGIYSEGGTTAYAFDFDTGENAVEFGGVPAIVHRWQDNEINVWVPYSAQSGPIVIKRGGTVPNADGSCCAKKEVVSMTAATFSVETPKVTSYAPTAAGLDEIVTIKGAGFGEFLKISEHTRLSLNQEAHDWKAFELGPNISRSEVLINGVAAHVLSWKANEIQVRVPRRHVFGFGNATGFNPDPTKGELIVRRGSWDLLENGKCCTSKRWVSAVGGDFTILRRGLPNQDYFNDPNPNRD